MKTTQILLTAAIAGSLWGGCSHGNDLTNGDGDQVRFRAAGTVTRTTTTGNTTTWDANDQVGIFMLTSGGSITTPSNVLAQNVLYTVADPETGALAPGTSSTPIYYPQTDSVDFVAYYPYATVTNGVYSISVTNQSDPGNIDVLYVKVSDVAKSTETVNLPFRHMLSMVTLNITLGEGMDELTDADITAVTFNGMPVAATLNLQSGTTTVAAVAEPPQTFNPLKAATATTDFDATFTAILVPQDAGAYTGRTVVFTVDGAPYTWTIPDNIPFEAGTHYTYPITINKQELRVGANTITPWTGDDREEVKINPVVE